jgi:hypothetical protein
MAGDQRMQSVRVREIRDYIDIIKQWVDQRCVIDSSNTGDLRANSRDLYWAFLTWHNKGPGFRPSEAVFVACLKSLEGVRYSSKLPSGKRGFWGIAVG